jgi:hypothetical protein
MIQYDYSDANIRPGYSSFLISMDKLGPSWRSDLIGSERGDIIRAGHNLTRVTFELHPLKIAAHVTENRDFF